MEMIGYSQVGQDEWVLSLFSKGYKGFFMDIGCRKPRSINNTLLLEENGWDGIAVDKENFKKAWQRRKARFIRTDALIYDYKGIVPDVVDYLSLDIDDLGTNYKALERFITLFKLQFKAITIEHNLYMGELYNQEDRLPQRKLLLAEGYKFARADVECEGNKFEDWWINPKYF